LTYIQFIHIIYMSSFEWDKSKNQINLKKHGVDFYEAQEAFLDPHRLILVDHSHSSTTETRYFCYGQVNNKILTVRFTYRHKKIRIFGAGYWRKERKIYEQHQQSFKR